MKLAALMVLVVAGRAAAEPLDVAMQRARQLGKPLVVEVGSSSCGPCKQFARAVLPDPSVRQALEDVVFLRYEADDNGEGEAAAKQLQVRAYPTFITFGEGRERDRRSGAMPAPAFLQLLADAAGVMESVETMHAKLKASPDDLGLELRAARWYRSRALPREALSHFAAVAASPKATAEQRRAATGAALHLRRTLRWRRELIDDAVALVRADPASAERDDVILATVGSTRPAEEAKSLVAKVLESKTDSDQRNSLVYVALAAGATDAALVAAKRNVEADRSAQRLDTLAEVHHARGERERALAIEDEALGMSRGGPHEAVLMENRLRFATGRQEAREVKEARARAEALRKRFESVDALDPAPLAPQERDREMREIYAAMDAENALVLSITKECRRWAGDTALVYARVHPKAGRIAGTTLFTDGPVPPALASCLKRRLDGAALPAGDRARVAERMLAIYFRPTAAEQ